MDPDLAFIQALQAGDESALDVIIERYQDAIFGYAWRQLRNEAAARDVAQEAFVRVYLYREKFQPRGATFRSWLYRIVSNLCTDQIRRNKRSPTALSANLSPEEESPLESLPADGPDPAEAAARAGEALALQDAIATLPAALREPLTLFCLEQRSQQECADILGITPKAVETKVGRARARLRAILGKVLRR